MHNKKTFLHKQLKVLTAKYHISYPDDFIIECECSHTSIRSREVLTEQNWVHQCPGENCQNEYKIIY